MQPPLSWLTINREKCEFAFPEAQFLGHYVTAEGIMPFQEKVEAIQAHPNPGVVSFNRHFVRGSIKIRCGSAEQEANTAHVGFYII